MDKNLSVIIVAGGSGQRMQSNIPKQFLILGNEPVLMHTIRRFALFEPTEEIIVVLPASQLSTWEELCYTYHFNIKHTPVIGGNNRFESVRAGLKICNSNNEYIAVHDGVRPLISEELLLRTYNHAISYGNAVPAIAVTDTLRYLNPSEQGGNKSVNRTLFRAIQTPQIFQTKSLQAAYKQPFQSHFTDDSSVLEQWGTTIHLSEGDYNNIKLTNPLDLIIARHLLNTGK